MAASWAACSSWVLFLSVRSRLGVFLHAQLPVFLPGSKSRRDFRSLLNCSPDLRSRIKQESRNRKKPGGGAFGRSVPRHFFFKYVVLCARLRVSVAADANSPLWCFVVCLSLPCSPSPGPSPMCCSLFCPLLHCHSFLTHPLQNHGHANFRQDPHG